MRTWVLPMMVLMLALVVSGCGQKGPLYRDSQGTSMTSGADSVQDEDQAGRKENRD
ncbi:MAG: lipoprotein [Pseudomonadota bacterium]|nr:lipoprotein [Pseudomonadota bacterium]